MNRILLSIGPISIYWYSFLIFMGILLGSVVAKIECKRKKIDFNFVTDLICYLVPISIVGARIYYVIFKFDSFKNDLLSIFYIWEGGLAIYGGIIAAVIFIIFYCKKKNKSVLTILDLGAPSLILGQGVGRWGNFFNQEAYGSITTLKHLKNLHIPNFIIENMFIDNAYRIPTFLYESLWCIVGFILLIILRKKTKRKGLVAGSYLIWYGIGRFLIETLRSDSLYIGVFKVSKIVSLIIIFIGVILLMKGEEIDERI